MRLTVADDKKRGDKYESPIAVKMRETFKLYLGDDFFKAMFVGPRGGRWADAAHTIPWRETVTQGKARSIARTADKTGKHGKEQSAETYERIKGDHVLVTVPISDLNPIEPGDSGRIKRYAEMGDTPPPIRLGYNERSAKRGATKLYVADGNHRVAAAKAKGHTHIEAMIPAEDHDRWSESREVGSSLNKALFIGPRGGKWADAQHTVPWHEEVPEKQLQEVAHSAVTKEVVEAAHRATAAGADPKSLKYVGAGMEGIIFEDDQGRAYKVSRPSHRKSGGMRDEAEALQSIQGTPAAKYVPKFYKYDRQHDVLVREKIEGRQGGGLTRGLSKVSDVIRAEMKQQDWTSPEFKSDAFIEKESGDLVMVDIGLVSPIGKRSAKRMDETIGDAKGPDDFKMVDVGFEIRMLLDEKAATWDKVKEWSRRIVALKGSDDQGVKSYLTELESKARRDGHIGKDEDLDLSKSARGKHMGVRLVINPTRDPLSKALFIGPRGGRWADAAHKIPFDADRHSAKVTIQRRASEQPAAPKKQLILIERRPAAAVTVDQKEERKIDQAVESVREKPAPKPAKLTVSQKAKSRKVLAKEQGEHVWGARKDKYEIRSASDLDTMTPTDQSKACTKSRLMPALDPMALMTQGKTPGCVLLRNAVQSAVAAKSGNNLEARKLYVNGIDFMSRSFDACNTGDDVMDFLTEWKHLAAGRIKGNSYTEDQIENARDDRFLEEAGRPPAMPWSERKTRGRELEESDTAVRVARMAKIVSEHRYQQDTSPENHKILEDAGDNYQEAYDAFHATRDKFIDDGGEEAKGEVSHFQAVAHAAGVSVGALSLATNQDGSVQTYVEDPSISTIAKDNKYAMMLASMGERLVKLVGGFKTPKPFTDAKHVIYMWERNKTSKEDQAKAVLEHMGTKRGKQKREPFRWERDVPGEINREGGREVGKANPKQFAKDFGLTNVQFGNWVSEDDADTHLRGAHGALFDLADMIGVDDPKIVSLNGRLSIGFGARGGGWGRAHYEPSRQIINITKIAGGGSLCHEWGHAIDNIIAVAADPSSTEADRWITDGTKPGVDPVVTQAMKNVMDAIRYEDPERAREIRRAEEIQIKARKERRGLNPEENEIVRENWSKGRAKLSEFYQDAIAFSGKSGYWQRPHEMFARAFESAMEDKLHSMGRVSSYLVSGTQKQYDTGKHRSDADKAAGKHAQPYPQGEERMRIGKAIERFIDVMREQGTLKKSLDALDYSARLVLGLGQVGQSKTVRLTVGSAR